ncbi:alkaline phosphatase family protein [Candidatus Poribacteria bacterium]|nr:alkaline phosphatase family protein [Candidatus Poribacteria bacterium]
MYPTVVLNVVGLTSSLLGQHTPHLSALAAEGVALPLRTITPAVTCAVQSTFLTGVRPAQHGVVGNGWYFRDLAEIWFWRQSNALVQGKKIWHEAKARDPAFTCCNMFWWYNMYSDVDISATPRPLYPADGRKIPDIYTEPPELRFDLQERLGTFPLFNFWGPFANIRSSRWIAEASRIVFDRFKPTLQLIYLPHLDYDLQRLGPTHPDIAVELGAIDAICGELIHHYRSAGCRIIVLSEYGITPVTTPVHPNRILREAGFLRVKDELGLEHLDAGASEAFAVSDHQIAHIYIKGRAKVPAIKALFEKAPGVERVLDAEGKIEYGLNHERSGELVLISAANSWFTYYYWFDYAKAPDFARTVDIHRKPGFDPVELFLDPSLKFPKLKIASKRLKKELGFRTLLDVIPLDASRVKGSHGRVTDRLEDGPVFITSTPWLIKDEMIDSTEVKPLIRCHLFESMPR